MKPGELNTLAIHLYGQQTGAVNLCIDQVVMPRTGILIGVYLSASAVGPGVRIAELSLSPISSVDAVPSVPNREISLAKIRVAGQGEAGTAGYVSNEYIPLMRSITRGTIVYLHMWGDTSHVCDAYVFLA